MESERPEPEIAAAAAGSQSAYTALNPFAGAPAGELDLFAFVLLLRRRIWRTLALAVLVSVAVMVWSLVVKPRYAATASVLIPQANKSAAGLLLQASTGIDTVGGGNEVFIDIMSSELVQDRLIARFKLADHYGAKELPQAEQALTMSTKFAATPEGLLRVSVTDTDPALAANLANAYLTELESSNQNFAMTAAGQQRRFYQGELIKEKEALEDAEVNLKQAQERTGLVEPTAQAQAAVAAEEQVRAQLRLRQVELNSLLEGATDQNPEVIRLRAEIASIEGELASMRSGGSAAVGPPTDRVPAQQLEVVRAQREVKFHETLFTELEREYELAHEREARDISVIEVLDRARQPTRKIWPPRTLYAIVAFFVGGVLGILLTALESLVGSIWKNPENQQRYRTLLAGKQVAAPSGRG